MNKGSYDVTIKGGKLKGVVNIPPSKSISHRALIAAGLSETVSTVRNIVLSDDILATMAAMNQFGATYEWLGEANGRHTYRAYRRNLDGMADSDKEGTAIFCNESGSTARFLIPFFHLMDGPVIFTGARSLSERPFKPYLDLFDEKGIAYASVGKGLPLKVWGKLSAGTYEVVGGVSSQFITGLLFMLPLLEGDSILKIKPPFESKDYVALTIDVLAAFGVEIEQSDPLTYCIRGGQTYKGTDYTVEGDYSQAAFWLVANALGSEIELVGLPNQSRQSDRAIVPFIETAKHQEAKAYDVSECPDLLPVLSVLLSVYQTKSEIVGGSRVRLKESDRIQAMAQELTKIGVVLEETPEGLIIQGGSKFVPAAIWAWNDHRIAMAMAVAAICIDGTLTVRGAECVRKSYPDFWEVYMKLGGDLIVEQHG